MASLIEAEKIGSKGLSYQFAGREMQALVVQLDKGDKLKVAQNAIAWLSSDVRIGEFAIKGIVECESSIGPSIVGVAAATEDSKIIALESGVEVVVKTTNFACCDSGTEITKLTDKLATNRFGFGGVELIELKGGQTHIWGRGDLITYKLEKEQELLVDQTKLVAWTKEVNHQNYSAVDAGGIQMIQGDKLLKIQGPGTIWLQLN